MKIREKEGDGKRGRDREAERERALANQWSKYNINFILGQMPPTQFHREINKKMNKTDMEKKLTGSQICK